MKNKEPAYYELGKLTFEKLDTLAQADDANAPELDFFLGDGKVLELLNQISSVKEETPDNGISKPEAVKEDVNIYSNALPIAPVIEMNAPEIRQEPVSTPRIQIQPEPAYAPVQPKSQDACPKCNAPISQGAQFCNSCGANLAQSAHQLRIQQEPTKNLCPHCGKELRSGAMFCTGCGQKV